MKKSTKAMFRKHGWRIDRFIHNYLYFVYYHPYVRLVYRQFVVAARYLSHFGIMAPVLRTAFNRYHSKVLSAGNIRQILTLEEDIRLVSENNRQIIPYRYATDIILRNPEHIAVMDCPCKKARNVEHSCGQLNSCLAVGEALAQFWIEHCEKYHARRITQQEALELVRSLRKSGHITQAFFKVATGGQTGVICNCCPRCCVSLESTRLARLWNDNLSMNTESGYSVIHNADACKQCRACTAVCHFGAIRFHNGLRTYDRKLCMGCELCVEHCPEGVLSLYQDREKSLPLDMDLVRERICSQQDVLND
jgi:Fe-S-cluster-containing hydrogenase component 2